MIALVDDDISTLQVFRDALLDAGHDAHIFQSPHLAVDFIKKNKGLVSVCVTDHNIPEMKGSLLAESVKKIDPDIQVLMISGFAVFTEAETLLKARVIDEFLSKPVRMDKFLQAVERRMKIYLKKKAL
jgi:DNA-binding NtrC family response regulator